MRTVTVAIFPPSVDNVDDAARSLKIVACVHAPDPDYTIMHDKSIRQRTRVCNCVVMQQQ